MGFLIAQQRASRRARSGITKFPIEGQHKKKKERGVVSRTFLGLGDGSSSFPSAAAAAAEDPVPKLEGAPRHEEEEPIGEKQARVCHRSPRLVRVQERVQPNSDSPQRERPDAEDGAVERQERAADVGEEGHPVQEDVPDGKKGVETCVKI